VNDEMNDDADSRPQLRLHAYHPRLDVLVVGVDGELDLLTAQELHACPTSGRCTESANRPRIRPCAYVGR